MTDGDASQGGADKLRILVTGARGTLGRPLVKELRSRGHEVHLIDMLHSPAENYLRCDVRDFRQLEQAFEVEPDLVYHLAAEFGRHNGDEFYEQCWTTNVIGTRNVIELCVRNEAKLIFSSSSEIYGELPDPHSQDYIGEDFDQLPLRPTNDYAISKWANELQIMNAEQVLGLQAMRMRFFNAYGPGEDYHPYRSVVCLFVNKLLRDEPIEVFRNYHRVFMYIDDFTPTLANACERFVAGEVVNIGGDEYRSVEELAKVCVEATGAGDPQVTYREEDFHNVQNKRPNIDKARKLLGHDPVTTLEEGVPLYVEWVKQQQEES